MVHSVPCCWIAVGLAIASFDATTGRDGPISFRTVAQGSQSGIDAHRELVVRTLGLWDFVWHKHSAGTPRPDIDFRSEMVLGVFAGRQSVAGRSVEIVSVVLDGGSVVVKYRERHSRQPQPEGETRSTPFHMVAIPIQQTAVRFEVTAEGSEVPQNATRTPPLTVLPSSGAQASTVQRPSTPRDGRRSGAQSVWRTLARFSALTNRRYRPTWRSMSAPNTE